jgi:hypothetical protein
MQLSCQNASTPPPCINDAKYSPDVEGGRRGFDNRVYYCIATTIFLGEIMSNTKINEALREAYPTTPYSSPCTSYGFIIHNVYKLSGYEILAMVEYEVDKVLSALIVLKGLETLESHTMEHRDAQWYKTEWRTPPSIECQDGKGYVTFRVNLIRQFS